MRVNPLFAAADEIQRVCLSEGWGFCVIGGLAVVRWGEPRLTRDVDLTVMAPFGSEAVIADALLDRFEPRLGDARAFALQNRVVLLRAANGTPVDVALGALDFEARTVARATVWDVPGAPLRTCGAEDLVVHKVFAGREQDWLDVEGVVMRQGGSLDRRLIEQELRPLLDVKGAVADLERLAALFGR